MATCPIAVSLDDGGSTPVLVDRYIADPPAFRHGVRQGAGFLPVPFHAAGDPAGQLFGLHGFCVVS
jgi:hypothetical protein